MKLGDLGLPFHLLTDSRELTLFHNGLCLQLHEKFQFGSIILPSPTGTRKRSIYDCTTNQSQTLSGQPRQRIWKALAILDDGSD